MKVFSGLSPLLGSHRIPFQVLAIASENVYIPSALVVLFHNENTLLKTLTLLFIQISTILWEIVPMRLQKVQFDWHSCPERVETVQ